MTGNKNYNFDNFDVTLHPERKSRERVTEKKSVSTHEFPKLNFKEISLSKRGGSKHSNGNGNFTKIAVCAVALVLVVSLIIGLVSCASGKDKTKKKDEQNNMSVEEMTLQNAKISAAQYDYDKAIADVKGLEKYATDTELQSLVSTWEQEKSTLVEFPHDQITHIFFHSLIWEPDLAFAPDNNKADGYNLVMTTVDEFNAIIQSMYDKNYVMVSMHDICTFDEQGNRIDHQIMLPPDKKAFVLSQDDLNYYHIQDGDGIATKLIIDENGKVINEYKKLDGSVTYGDFDVVPLIDRFVEKHPEFSYKGHKGILALTGYNGVLGYRTDSVYADINDPNLDPDQIQFLEANPDFDYQKEVEEAKKVADKMKENGWEFATHTWGHRTVPDMSMDTLTTDTGKWRAYVEPVVGKTDVMIFPNGSDLTGTGYYDSSIERFNYLYSEGIRIFCPVDSTPYWQQKGDNYFRMSRRNLDGYRMYHNPERCEDLFDPNAVFDKKRPLPVPTMEEVYG